MSKIITGTEKNFTELTEANGLVLIDFHATWCGPCKMMSPILNELANEIETDLTIVKVDVDSERTLAAKFQIQSIPTLVIIKDGIVKKTLLGLQDKSSLINKLKST